MKTTEVLRLVWLNIIQNKFKTIMTSIGIVAGAATIVMVIAIGRGGQMDVAEQFSNLNAGAIDVSYDWEGEEIIGGNGFFRTVGEFFGGMQGMFGGPGMGRGSENAGGSSDRPSNAGRDGDAGAMADGGGFENAGGMMAGGRENAEERPDGDISGGNAGERPDGDIGGGNAGERPDGDISGGNAGEPTEGNISGEADRESGNTAEGPEETDKDSVDASEESDVSSIVDDRMNQEQIILTAEDVDDIETFVPGITGATISYSTRISVEGGTLTEPQTYTVAGVKESYAHISNLVMAEGEFLTGEDDANKSRVCVLGSTLAKELFGSAAEAYGGTLYIDDRTYTVTGVLAQSGMVSAGLSPDEVIFVPYETGIKYITGDSISPVITVVSENVNAIEQVEENIAAVLLQNYDNAEFTFSDAGSKMEAAESSNVILTMLLTAMAVIVFIVGGIGIMNVLFVSVKERTNEIGILKALGASQGTILSEFLIESAAISLLGGLLGVGISFIITPVVEHYGVRVEANLFAWLSALAFAVLTGTLFGFYPAWKASRLVPVEALQAE